MGDRDRGPGEGGSRVRGGNLESDPVNLGRGWEDQGEHTMGNPSYIVHPTDGDST